MENAPIPLKGRAVVRKNVEHESSSCPKKLRWIIPESHSEDNSHVSSDAVGTPQTHSLPTLRCRPQPLFDSGVLGLVGKIEEFVECYSLLQPHAGRVLEVEGRIGVLRDNDTTERIRLPVDTEVLLDPSNSSFSYRFESGTTKDIFQRLTDALHGALGVETDYEGNVDENARVYERDPVLFSSTLDHFVDLNESYFNRLNIPRNSGHLFDARRVRLSYPLTDNAVAGQPGNQTPVEVIWKDRLFVLDFYTGRNKEEAASVDSPESCHLLDIRIAINIEYQLPVYLEVPRPLMIRQRQRISYPLKGRFRVDATKVKERSEPRTMSSHHQEKEVYELEVEINPKLLLHELRNKMEGKPHCLYHLVHDFLGLLRDMAYFVTASSMSRNTLVTKSEGRTSSENLAHGGASAAKQESAAASPAFTRPLIDLRDNEQPPEALQTYLSYVSPVVPLIGDYLYRAVAPASQQAQEPPLDTAECQTLTSYSSVS